MEWVVKHQILIQHIQPGKPQQMCMWNALIVPLGRNGYRCITGKSWMNCKGLQHNRCINRPKRIPRDNHQRPNMALGGITPKQRLAMVA